jgi:hypothetical protein
MVSPNDEEEEEVEDELQMSANPHRCAMSSKVPVGLAVPSWLSCGWVSVMGLG